MSSKRNDSKRTTLLHTGNNFEYTTIDLDQEGEAKTVTLEGKPEEALQNLVANHSLSEDVETAISASDTLMMVLQLPATEAAEIQGMLELQAEEISPFPPEATLMAWEALQSFGRQTQVLMALCSRKPLDKLHDLYAKVGTVPSRVDIDVLGWLELIKKDHLSDTEDGLVFLLQGNQSYAVAWHQGHPCLIRSLVGAREFSQETLEEELMMLLLALESSFPEANAKKVQVWHDGELPAWAKEPLEEWDIQVEKLDTLPPLTQGLALRGRRADSLDISPKEWREEKQRNATRKRTIQRTSLIVGGWLILMVGFLGWSVYRQSGLRSVEKLNTANTQAVTDVENLSMRVRSLTQFTDRSSSALENLLTLATAAPGSGSIVIEDYRYEKAEGITLSGSTSGDVQPFYQFLERLSAGESLRVTSYDLKESRQGFSFQAEAVWAWIEAENEETSP